MTPKLVLIACSGGGHWIQMTRLLPALGDVPIALLTVDSNSAACNDVADFKFVSSIPDFNRRSLRNIPVAFLLAFKLLKRTRPSHCISTGAAPGLITLLIAKILFGSTCLWIDSIANSKKLSLSGRCAKLFGITVFSQWEAVASKFGCLYRGRVL
jgi:UDP-N-acetylglucosamine:LPS N-acetylglucosamine transferase